MSRSVADRWHHGAWSEADLCTSTTATRRGQAGRSQWLQLVCIQAALEGHGWLQTRQSLMRTVEQALRATIAPP